MSCSVEVAMRVMAILFSFVRPGEGRPIILAVVLLCCKFGLVLNTLHVKEAGGAVQ